MPHYQPPTTHRKFARTMRSDSTKAEEMLWQQLKNRQIEKYKFRRQVPLEGFIVDFACFEAKLVIEVDGSQHAESESDLRRDALLNRQGFPVLRFWNEEVEASLDFVIHSIVADLVNTGE